MRLLPDTFALADDALAVAERLRVSCPEFAHLADSRIVFVASQQPPMLRGHRCYAFIANLHVQGPLRVLHDWLFQSFVAPQLEADAEPDYVVILDAALWASWDATKREWLVYHELCHVGPREDPATGVQRIGRDGRLMTQLRPHDFEFFATEVERYGPLTAELEDAARAIAAGYRAIAPATAA